MGRGASILCLLLTLALLLAACGAPAAGTEPSTTAPEPSGAAVDVMEPVLTEQALSEIRALGTCPEDNYRTWYEIFVYSFCDSDGDGIGDLAGVTSKLDYLQELGITGIWLMPIHPSVSYHKYSVSDYYAIDSDYGTMEDFDALLKACNERGIRVILDLVLNHTGSDHPWFREACDYLRSIGDGEPDKNACPYLGYYFFTRDPQGGYHQVEGTDWYYESQFSHEMPDLNLGNQAVRDEIEAIMGFWLDKGVAGFRLDAVKEFYSGSPTKNIEVLAWLQETATAIRPDAYLVAEAWDNFATIANYYQSGLTSFFDFPFGNSEGKIISVLRAAGTPGTVSTYATALEKADAAYLAANPDYIDAPFLSNHDVGRIAGFCSADPQKTKLAGAMNLFMSGSAFIYYGEELGMTGSGNDPSKRAPMYWNEARNEGTTLPPPQCELPESYPFPSLEIQAKDDASIYNYYRQAIAIRNAIPALSRGRTTAETELNQGCVSAFRKTWGEESCLVLLNIAPESAQVDLGSYPDYTLAAKLSAEGSPITLEAGVLTLPPYGAAVLLPPA